MDLQRQNKIIEEMSKLLREMLTLLKEALECSVNNNLLRYNEIMLEVEVLERRKTGLQCEFKTIC